MFLFHIVRDVHLLCLVIKYVGSARSDATGLRMLELERTETDCCK